MKYHAHKSHGSPYTCSDYRQEMQLNALLRRLATESLPPEQRRQLKHDIRLLKQSMGLLDENGRREGMGPEN